MHVSARFSLLGLHCEKPLQGCAWSHPRNCRVPLRYHPGNCRVLWCMVSTGSDPGSVVVGYMSQCLILGISECCSWRSSSQDIIPVSHTGDHHWIRLPASPTCVFVCVIVRYRSVARACRHSRIRFVLYVSAGCGVVTCRLCVCNVERLSSPWGLGHCLCAFGFKSMHGWRVC